MHSTPYQGPKVNVCLDSFLHLSPKSASCWVEKYYIFYARLLEVLKKELSSWTFQVCVSCGQLNFQFLQVWQELDFCLKLISLLHQRCAASGSLYNLLKSPSLWSLSLSCVLLLTTTYNKPDCESTIVMPVMSAHSYVSQHHPALLFAQGQVL